MTEEKEHCYLLSKLLIEDKDYLDRHKEDKPLFHKFNISSELRSLDKFERWCETQKINNVSLLFPMYADVVSI